MSDIKGLGVYSSMRVNLIILCSTMNCAISSVGSDSDWEEILPTKNCVGIILLHIDVLKKIMPSLQNVSPQACLFLSLSLENEEIT